MKTLARIISVICGPITLMPVLIFMIFDHSELSLSQMIFVVPLLLLFTLLIPFGYIYLAYKNKKIKDLDMTKREERIKPFLMTIISLGFCLILLLKVEIKPIFNIYILFITLAIINGLITLFWKISLHMAINIIFVIYSIYLYGIQAYFLFFLIPMIFWSRLHLKKHTVMQLVVSLLLNGIITYFFLFFPLAIEQIFQFF